MRAILVLGITGVVAGCAPQTSRPPPTAATWAAAPSAAESRWSRETYVGVAPLPAAPQWVNIALSSEPAAMLPSEWGPAGNATQATTSASSERSFESAGFRLVRSLTVDATVLRDNIVLEGDGGRLVALTLVQRGGGAVRAVRVTLASGESMYAKAHSIPTTGVEWIALPSGHEVVREVTLEYDPQLEPSVGATVELWGLPAMPNIRHTAHAAPGHARY